MDRWKACSNKHPSSIRISVHGGTRTSHTTMQLVSLSCQAAHTKHLQCG